ncbi:MAG: tRNA lysidine(34) synthetase TilS [Candidatus Omnitrophica bacterium]|nr:tRNA lysidine(34) synthetase TilS [Candidatus Omnitrophota bacterium]MCM8789000.1 tRNA lysidine(34) synthetase TilS [Candidatus Omnitrophota bacterium]
MSKEIQQIIDRITSEIRVIPDDGGILFAVSGGPDSVALVDICASNFPDVKKRMHIAYINHGLRKNADREKIFVKNLAGKLAVPFHFKKILVKPAKNKSLEEQARIKRYQALVQIAKKHGCSSIVAGHTMDDQVETILLNLATGTGLKGLCGMQPISKIDNDLLLVRPFLSITKKQILSYLEEKKIDYLFDESNIDTRFKRNLIRCQLLPLFEKINAGVRKNIYRTSRILTDDFDYVDTQVRKIIQRKVTKGSGFVEFPTKSFLKMHISLQRFFLRNILIDLCKLDHPPDFTTIEKIRLSIISRKKIFVDKLKIYVAFIGEGVSLYRKNFFEGSIEKSIPIKTPGITEIPCTGWEIKTAFRNFSKKFLKNPNPLAAYINPDRITDTLVVKKPEKNISFVPLGIGKKISFKKYWKTHKKKINQFIGFPLIIEDSGKLVWVVGGHISQQYAISEETRVFEIIVEKK